MYQHLLPVNSGITSMSSNTNQKQISEAITGFMLAEYQILADKLTREIERGQSYVNLFLTIASGIAALLALMSQIAATSFRFVSIPILLVLFLLGMISYLRVVQRDIRITTHVRHMGRIRHYFVEVEPSIQPYLPQSPYDDKAYIPKGIDRIGLRHVVALINSSVTATVVFLIANTVADLWASAVIAVITFFVSLMLHESFTKARYREAELQMEVRFPSEHKPGRSARGS
jgi:hypothetical protein